MDLSQYIPKTNEEYISMVRVIASLIDTQLRLYETSVEEGSKSRLYDVILQMPALISLVNTVGYLRGQDGMFLDIRPKPLSEHQKELYSLEHMFEERLYKIIQKLDSSELKDRYIERLNEYFINHRRAQSTP